MPAEVLLVVRAPVLAHSHRMKRLMNLPWPVCRDWRLPALLLVPGINAVERARLARLVEACHVVIDFDEDPRPCVGLVSPTP